MRELPWPCLIGVPEFCFPDKADVCGLLVGGLSLLGVLWLRQLERRWRR